MSIKKTASPLKVIPLTALSSNTTASQTKIDLNFFLGSKDT